MSDLRAGSHSCYIICVFSVVPAGVAREWRFKREASRNSTAVK